MKPILIATAQHTGTHTIKRLLETSPDVPLCLKGEPVRDRCHDFANDRISEFEFNQAMASWRLERSERLQTAAIKVAKYHGYNLLEQGRRRPQRDLLHSHAHDELVNAGDKFKIVAGVRDPVLSICTALRKHGHAQGAVATINALAAMGQVIWFDVEKINRDTVAELFRSLNLTPSNNATWRFADVAPRINATHTERKPGMAGIALEHGGCPPEYREAKDLYERTGEIHEVLKPWLTMLRPLR